VFEGLRAYNGRIFRLAEHLARLEASARAILLPVPQSRDELAELHREVLRRSGLEQAYLRTVLTRGACDLGLDLRKCPTPSLIIIATTLKMFPPEKFEAGIRVVTAGTPAPHREALSPRVKSLNYLPHVM